MLRLYLAALALLVAPAHFLVAQTSARELVIGVAQFPSSLHPAIDPMYAKAYLLAMTRRPVTAYDAGSRLVCMLCTELPSFANGRARRIARPDGSEAVAVTYTLKPAAWADGQALSAGDVAFSWQVGRLSGVGYADTAAYQRIQSVEVADERTFTVILDRLVADYNHLPIEILPSHLESGPVGAPETYRSRTTFVTEPTKPGLSSGPYRIAEFTPGGHAVLVRNPHWLGPVPAFERIIVRAIENTAALEAALLAGEVDYVPGDLGLAVEQARALGARQPDRFRIVYRTALHYEHVDINPDNQALRDIRVRRALLHALNREELATRLFGRAHPVAHSPVNPSDPNYNPAVPTYPYDVAKAGLLLDDAGWRLDDRGVRRNGQGETLAVEIVSTAGNRSRELAQQVLQSQWQAIGVTVTLRLLSPKVFFAELLHHQLPSMALFAWPTAPQQPPRSTLHSTQIPSAATGGAGYNVAGYRNPEADRLIEAIEVEFDDHRRARLWARLQTLYAEDLPALPLFFRVEPHVLPVWLDGVSPTGHQYPSTLWVEDWRDADRVPPAPRDNGARP